MGPKHNTQIPYAIQIQYTVHLNLPTEYLMLVVAIQPEEAINMRDLNTFCRMAATDGTFINLISHVFAPNKYTKPPWIHRLYCNHKKIINEFIHVQSH